MNDLCVALGGLLLYYMCDYFFPHSQTGATSSWTAVLTVSSHLGCSIGTEPFFVDHSFMWVLLL